MTLKRRTITHFVQLLDQTVGKCPFLLLKLEPEGIYCAESLLSYPCCLGLPSKLCRSTIKNFVQCFFQMLLGTQYLFDGLRVSTSPAAYDYMKKNRLFEGTTKNNYNRLQHVHKTNEWCKSWYSKTVVPRC